ncbi:MAG: SMC-Scp complex subunit ScpB [Fimbriimonadaceae bacterium]|nr:SMC-Scp complex subunit ScpB [Fimbriimonadaceae bacterium]QYK55644.1 MAG: SMC-Scp complex subunit ScpB [Fimbriimonadaceae bacterium]
MNVQRAVEALLFMADSPASPEELARAIGVAVYAVEEALEKLGGRLHHESGLQLLRIAGGYQLCTKPEYAEAVARFTQPQQHRMSRSLMEVLAIVAYQQPVTTAEIDSVRGVDSSYAIRQLVERRLITEVGRKKSPGRPMLYGTTQQFLHAFKLDDLSALPPLESHKALTVGGHLPPDQSQFDL